MRMQIHKQKREKWKFVNRLQADRRASKVAVADYARGLPPPQVALRQPTPARRRREIQPFNSQPLPEARRAQPTLMQHFQHAIQIAGHNRKNGRE